MSNQKIDAPRITKPIQLLASWLIGLVLVDGTFLATAISIGDHWERSALVIASVLNVPGFLFAIFLLQTKFRPELQEDVFYSRYISKKTSSRFEINKIDAIGSRVSELYDKIEVELASRTLEHPASTSLNLDWSRWKIAINVQLPFFSELRDAFRGSKIPVEVNFGSEADALTTYDVSISEEMSSQHVLEILKVIYKFPIDKIYFWHPLREVGEDEDVYIGSYGGGTNAITLTESLRLAISQAKDAVDIMKLRGQTTS